MTEEDVSKEKLIEIMREYYRRRGKKISNVRLSFAGLARTSFDRIHVSVEDMLPAEVVAGLRSSSGDKHGEAIHRLFEIACEGMNHDESREMAEVAFSSMLAITKMHCRGRFKVLDAVTKARGLRTLANEIELEGGCMSAETAMIEFNATGMCPLCENTGVVGEDANEKDIACPCTKTMFSELQGKLEAWNKLLKLVLEDANFYGGSLKGETISKVEKMLRDDTSRYPTMTTVETEDGVIVAHERVNGDSVSAFEEDDEGLFGNLDEDVTE